MQQEAHISAELFLELQVCMLAMLIQMWFLQEHMGNNL
jgi:hypothetical protein